MKKLMTIETDRVHDEETGGIRVRARTSRDPGRETLIFGFDPRQGELENHLEAASTLLADQSPDAGITAYAELGHQAYLFITTLKARP